MTRPRSSVTRKTRSLATPAWARMTTLGLLLSTSACSSVSQYVRNATQHKESVVATADDQIKDPSVTHAYTSAEKPHTAKIQPLEHVEAAASKPAVAQIPAPSEGTASTASAQPAVAFAAVAAAAPPSSSTASPRPMPSGYPEDPFENLSIQKTSGDVDSSTPTAACPPICHDPIPRLPEDTVRICPQGAGPSACPPGAPCAMRPCAAPEIVGDEYVCDGGDKHLPVHYQGTMRAGLDTEDTVGEFIDDDRKAHVKPSTEVCIYAPRFGAVRSATQPLEGVAIDKALGHQDLEMVTGLESKVRADEKLHTDELQAMRMRSRASGTSQLTAEDTLHQELAAVNREKVWNAFEDYQYFQAHQFTKYDIAITEKTLAFAIEWSDGRRPVIAAQTLSCQTVTGRAQVHDYTGVEDRRKPGDLKIVKTADKASAHPGDLVTFTLKFENTGDRELLRVRLVDNLSPRLEFVDGSVDSNLDGKISTESNGAGGTLLTFLFDKPLAGHAEGRVTFQCRVR